MSEWGPWILLLTGVGNLLIGWVIRELRHLRNGVDEAKASARRAHQRIDNLLTQRG